jgi:hypothetical protein
VLEQAEKRAERILGKSKPKFFEQKVPMILVLRFFPFFAECHDVKILFVDIKM